MDDAFSQIRNIIRGHLSKMSELSVYDPQSLFEKGKMLADLQEITATLRELHQMANDGENEQRQALEKQMREVEEKFNAVRQNLRTEKPKVVIEEPTPVSTVVVSEQAIVKKTKKEQNGWIEVVKSTKKKTPTAQNNEPKLVNHELVQGVFIKAYTINNPEQCHKLKGWWCYCPDIDRFCTSLNGEIIVGTVTNIRHSSKTPKKFSEDRRSEAMDWTKSNYYVPRDRNPESRDVREFTNKMKFVPASQEPKKFEAYCYRIGSKDTLQEDVVKLQAEDYRLFADLTSNFLLCWTVAAQEMRRRESTGML